MFSSVDRKTNVQILYEWGINVPKKLTKLSELCLSQVCRIIKRIKSGDGVSRRPGSGKPSEFNKSDRKSDLKSGT